MKTDSNKKLIRKISSFYTKAYNLNYEEYENTDENYIEIVAKLKIDLSSKAAVKRLNKSWKKDKSPLLTELQEIQKNHEKAKKEEKEGIIYTPYEIDDKGEGKNA